MNDQAVATKSGTNLDYKDATWTLRTEKVFVYGTLRTHATNWMWTLRPQIGKSDVVHGYVMYNSPHGGFPIASPGKSHEYIIGEVFDVTEKMLAKLDQLEGFPHHYDRTLVTTENDDVVWIYFQKDASKLERIEGGDWLKHIGKPLFVYGTLKTRHTNWFHYMRPQIGKPAVIDGWTLYNANGTARMAPDNSGNAVVGEIFLIYPGAFDTLDPHEGYDKNRSKKLNIYNRIKVETMEGETVWVYVDETAHDYYPHYGNDWTEHICPKCGEQAKRVFNEKNFHVYAHELVGRTATVWCRVAK